MLDVLRDKQDIRRKFDFLFNPQNIKTASRLSASQVEFVADAYTAFKYYPEFEALKELAKEVSECNISLDGKGRKESIDFELASRPAQTPSTTFSILTGKDGKQVKESKESKDEKK